MSNAKSTSRSLYIDQSSAELALDRLTKKMKALETEIGRTVDAVRQIHAQRADWRAVPYAESHSVDHIVEISDILLRLAPREILQAAVNVACIVK